MQILIRNLELFTRIVKNSLMKIAAHRAKVRLNKNWLIEFLCAVRICILRETLDLSCEEKLEKKYMTQRDK